LTPSSRPSFWELAASASSLVCPYFRASSWSLRPLDNESKQRRPDSTGLLKRTRGDQNRSELPTVTTMVVPNTSVSRNTVSATIVLEEVQEVRDEPLIRPEQEREKLRLRFGYYHARPCFRRICRHVQRVNRTFRRGLLSTRGQTIVVRLQNWMNCSPVTGLRVGSDGPVPSTTGHLKPPAPSCRGVYCTAPPTRPRSPRRSSPARYRRAASRAVPALRQGAATAVPDPPRPPA